MKKLVCFLAAVMLALMAVMPIASARDGVNTMYVKTGNGRCLLVRSGPSKDYPVIYSLAYGSVVYAPIGSESGSWTYIMRGKRSGYVMTKYLTDTKPETYTGADSAAMSAMKDVETPFTVTLKGVRKGGTANLRMYADKSSKLLMKLLPGTQVTVLAESVQWYKVQTADGMTGYVNKQFVQQ